MPSTPALAHTPTPWQFGSASIYKPARVLAYRNGDGRQQVCVAQCREGNVTIGEHDLNAAFIVRACNSHDALVAALREIADRGPVEGYGAADALRLRLVATQSIARAALAAVSGDAHD